ncbi:NAD-dependent epimerase/dehydratase family protein [Paracraurococcus lichenis]|uniref:NAD-dependent epimerase/dehydratase family protein n=1 Tax=Paracraurococcus lichenis TaxID=3064888 RepID=A0ABT9ED64_9PROT|nr:NAD-dependent epimerase/dehydratase family protein [Paracraurococcus sp. LOR1-02]MDO9714011.1 NAD-dependent epimerase/dehydratase family protein [Paracraurococcus sp. LOR1-02]
MTNVLIAGGAGFLGSHLLDRLLRRKDIARLIVIDNLWTGLRNNLAHINDPRVDIQQVDAERVDSVTTFDEIYHLASPASPPWYMAEPLRTVSANVLGTLRLLAALKPHGRFCFTSTSEVYGDPLVSPQPESYRGSVDCTGPRASYDESKRCAEAILFEARRTQGVRIKVVRLFNVFGPRTRPDDGRAVSNFITQGLRGSPITVYGAGSQTRSWGYVDDVVDALERFFWLEESEFPGPLNIGNDREVPVVEVAHYVRRHFPRSQIQHLDPVPQDPTNRRPDLTLARRHLPGWECKISYEEGVDRTIRWFRNTVSNLHSPKSLDAK